MARECPQPQLSVLVASLEDVAQVELVDDDRDDDDDDKDNDDEDSM